MKAVIMTTALSENYGAALQSYALVEKLKTLGVEAYNYRYNDPNRIRSSMSGLQRIKHGLWSLFVACITLNKKKKNFVTFQEEHLSLTEKRLRTHEDLKKQYGEYDLFIAGSDQIWNPQFFVYDLSYYLDFLPPEKKRISYASSFGKAEFGNGKYKDRCAELLKLFSYISVREQSGTAIVKELCGRQAEWVLDPTLLLTAEEWLRLVHKKELTEEIILCYVMPGDKAVTDAIEKIARDVSKDSGLPIVRLGMKAQKVFRYGKKGCDITAGPMEFVEYFSKAKCVVTNSFHGTAFSLVFGKELLVPINDSLNAKRALHERVKSLLTLIGAETVMVPVSTMQKGCFDRKTYEYSRDLAGEKLRKERERSLDFLKTAIGEMQ